MGNSLKTRAQVVVLREQGFHSRLDAPAVAAAVVEELDQRDRYWPSGLPATGASGSEEDLVAVAPNDVLRLFGLLCGPLGLKRLPGLDQHLGVLQQVVPDDLADGVHRQIAWAETADSPAPSATVLAAPGSHVPSSTLFVSQTTSACPGSAAVRARASAESCCGEGAAEHLVSPWHERDGEYPPGAPVASPRGTRCGRYSRMRRRARKGSVARTRPMKTSPTPASRCGPRLSSSSSAVLIRPEMGMTREKGVTR